MAAVACLCLAGPLALPAQAQTVTTLVSNIGQSNTETAASFAKRAQPFTTGSNASGYTLSSIDVVSANSSSQAVSASVCTVNSSGHPTSTCTSLTAPSSFSAGTLSFTAPANATLAASTTYAVVFTVADSTTAFSWSHTSDDGEDAAGATGWTIGNAYLFRIGTPTWTEPTSGASHRIAINGSLALPAQAQTTNFYLWRTTMTVGVDEATSPVAYRYAGYHPTHSTGAIGSISTDADFGFPPWNPPHKHHVDRDSYITVGSVYETVISSEEGLFLLLPQLPDTGNVTLWLDHKKYPLSSASYATDGYQWRAFSAADWEEDDEVKVALVYERRLPSAPTNVSVTAPPGEEGTLEVSWDEADDGTFPIECYLVEFRHPAVRPGTESSPTPALSVPEKDAATARRPACGARTLKRASNTRSSCRR